MSGENDAKPWDFRAAVPDFQIFQSEIQPHLFFCEGM